MLPFAQVLGHRDEVTAEKYAPNPTNAEKPGGEGGFRGLLCRAKLTRAAADDRLPGQKFERGGVRGGFGLDEHDPISFALDLEQFQTIAT
jgi:hypothetical protein